VKISEQRVPAFCREAPESSGSRRSFQVLLKIAGLRQRQVTSRLSCAHWYVSISFQRSLSKVGGNFGNEMNRSNSVLYEDIPVVPTVTATITFQDFEFRKDFDDSFFTIPSDYVEDPNR
jgi:hypothetical protein